MSRASFIIMSNKHLIYRYTCMCQNLMNFDSIFLVHLVFDAGPVLNQFCFNLLHVSQILSVDTHSENLKPLQHLFYYTLQLFRFYRLLFKVLEVTEIRLLQIHLVLNTMSLVCICLDVVVFELSIYFVSSNLLHTGVKN